MFLFIEFNIITKPKQKLYNNITCPRPLFYFAIQTCKILILTCFFNYVRVANFTSCFALLFVGSHIHQKSNSHFKRLI